MSVKCNVEMTLCIYVFSNTITKRICAMKCIYPFWCHILLQFAENNMALWSWGDNVCISGGGMVYDSCETLCWIWIQALASFPNKHWVEYNAWRLLFYKLIYHSTWMNVGYKCLDLYFYSSAHYIAKVKIYEKIHLLSWNMDSFLHCFVFFPNYLWDDKYSGVLLYRGPI